MIVIFLLLNFLSDNLTPQRFYSQKSECSGYYNVSTEWKLSLEDQHVFKLNYHYLNTEMHQELKDTVSGIWSVSSDTLRLTRKSKSILPWANCSYLIGKKELKKLELNPYMPEMMKAVD